jgi:hypothetical protein
MHAAVAARDAIEWHHGGALKPRVAVPLARARGGKPRDGVTLQTGGSNLYPHNGGALLPAQRRSRWWERDLV